MTRTDRFEAWAVSLWTLALPLWDRLQPFAVLVSAFYLAYRWMLTPGGFWPALGVGLLVTIGITLARSSGLPAEDALGIVLTWPVLVAMLGIWHAYRFAVRHELADIACEFGNAVVLKAGELILWKRPARHERNDACRS